MLKIALNTIALIACLLPLNFIQAQVISETGLGIAIPDNGSPTLSCYDFTVSGVGNIDDTYGLTEVCINISHTWTGDLDIFLQSPDGTFIELSTDNGGSGDNYTNTCFSMGSASPVTGGTAPFSAGPYLPEGNLNSVNNGQNANGTWSICVSDDAGGDTGTLNGVQLTFGGSPPGPFPGVDEFITTPGGGTINGCAGTVFDPGYTANYGPNSVTTQTFCSDNGSEISLDFGAGDFGIAFGDVLSIYDGTSTATTPIISGTTNPGIITSTTGCLTVELSTGASGDIGFEASISCPTCMDGIQNGNETGIDCGGPDCVACPNCFNGIQDGNETGIDCGPSCPDPCHCSNGILDGDETDVDCGGSCGPCPEPCTIDLTWSVDGTGSTTFPGGTAYSMNTSTVNTCGGTFLDPGGNGD